MKYRFRLSGTSFIDLTEEEMKEYEQQLYEIEYCDGTKEDGIRITVTRDYDKKHYNIIVPKSMIEEIEENEYSS